MDLYDKLIPRARKWLNVAALGYIPFFFFFVVRSCLKANAVSEHFKSLFEALQLSFEIYAMIFAAGVALRAERKDVRPMLRYLAAFLAVTVLAIFSHLLQGLNEDPELALYFDSALVAALVAILIANTNENEQSDSQQLWNGLVWIFGLALVATGALAWIRAAFDLISRIVT